MKLTTPTLLTLLRIALVPVLVVLFYVPYTWSNLACVVIFVLAAVTDIADGAIARKTGQTSRFGAFLDPVADKIMVSTALVLLVQRQETYQVVFAIAAAVIIGREIAISALREWMSELGERTLVSVSWVGKTKTVFQMTAIGFLLYHENIGWIPVALIGELLLYTAAALTLWSMWTYLSAAWPVMSRSQLGDDDGGGAGR
ncbi:MAG: CDP-diacylglycerol--glycerol-3-phosphate 3-phosphatidyltransferase [Xanthomonadales bacterium]|jgi:CDP-diacylglycerol--glycerol-3-phosphate 3-phosphatidyltransferase|nr:CDP-diacylglycerol--glycerol-3-phosphate 3-phosphatidyltransferase [Xanthomonadales bacterium]